MQNNRIQSEKAWCPRFVQTIQPAEQREAKFYDGNALSPQIKLDSKLDDERTRAAKSQSDYDVANSQS